MFKGLFIFFKRSEDFTSTRKYAFDNILPKTAFKGNRPLESHVKLAKSCHICINWQISGAKFAKYSV